MKADEIANPNPLGFMWAFGLSDELANFKLEKPQCDSFALWRASSLYTYTFGKLSYLCDCNKVVIGCVVFTNHPAQLLDALHLR